ncbi:MAG: DNA mismatch repair endonuclease MutL [Oscillospiraceae bacterium]|nr:DNA mismatch repair endonuclease MutL [Oscillospiraceae bacterium]MCL2249635.1 DNA mismatch repair endonuclease MutL [Oscillospiraceae bacterium]
MNQRLPKILKLEQHVADLIAAGEVVEKPASVVKELLENGVDAGAGVITVEIAGGGMKYIRVTDNGIGIAPEEAETAFLRHATSKLSDARGLEAIGTLGFRGEALAAIAAVSRVTMQTRQKESAEGIEIALEAGKVLKKSPVGCPEGTTIIIRDLFFNTPARLKFMKSDRAEGSAVAAVVTRLALSRPDISVRFIKDKKQEYHTPGDSRIDSAIYSLLGREVESGLISAATSDDTVNVKGYVSKPSAARGNRGYQFFFVNGRTVKSQLLQTALEQAYRNILPGGRFPSCVLYIESGLNTVDVNVHPAKTEIKFVSDKQFYDGVYYAALGALDKYQRQGEGSLVSPPLSAPVNASVPVSQANRPPVSAPMRVAEPRQIYKRQPENYPAGKELAHTAGATLTPATPSLLSPEPYRVIGETMTMYIIVEQGENVLFIDKHAAHERIHFDALRKKNHKPMSEALLTPIICRLGHEDTAVLLESAEFLDDLGFTAESFGEDCVAVRYIPAEISIDDVEQTLAEICEKLRQSGVAETEKRDSIYKTIACKAAIKAGRSSSQNELEKLAEKVMCGEVTHCPHGRPIVYKLTKTTLDKNLGRV